MRVAHVWLLFSAITGCLVGTVRGYEIRAQVGLSSSDNLSRTSAANYRMAATTGTASVSVVQSRQLTPRWLLVATGEAGAESVSKFPALDACYGGVRLLGRYKFGIGPLAPVLELNAGAVTRSYHESGRSGWQSSAGLTLAKRLTETWRVAATTGAEEFAARGKPFDVRSHHLQLETDWDFSEDWRLTLGAKRLWGQLTANADGDVYYRALGGAFGPRISNYYWHIPWAVTNTFGPEWIAYRVDCYADFRWIEVSYALTPNTSLPLRHETVKVVNRAGVAYDTSLWSLNIVHRF